MSVLFFTPDITIHKQRETHVLTHRAREGARAHIEGPSHWYNTYTYPVQTATAWAPAGAPADQNAPALLHDLYEELQHATGRGGNGLARFASLIMLIASLISAPPAAVATGSRDLPPSSC